DVHVPADGARRRRRRHHRAERLSHPPRLPLPHRAPRRRQRRPGQRGYRCSLHPGTGGNDVKLEPAALVTIPDGERPNAATQPPYDYPAYISTELRSPKRPLLILPEGVADPSGPVFGEDTVRELDSDLTRQHSGEPLGERIIVTGRVLEKDG